MSYFFIFILLIKESSICALNTNSFIKNGSVELGLGSYV
jgi:hypothetical protein